jgi:arabinofuranan 3-O-arabinosyltransferase
MSEALETLSGSSAYAQQPPRLLGVFVPWRLQAYGYTLAAAYAAFAFSLNWFGFWLVDNDGVPVYHDFTNLFVAGSQALHGKISSIYNPTEFIKVQDALVGPGHALFSTWPSPPLYFLVLAPLSMLPYVAAFLSWEALTLLGCISVVYLIVRRPPAIALVLASPFTAWNFLIGQSGFLTALLVGASLLVLKRRPVLAGVFIGCLTYKPQWGILFPVALVAANEWRAIASATLTFVFLVGLSVFAFGVEPWIALPRELIAEANETLVGIPGGPWGYIQTVYGLVRVLHCGPTLAWLIQGMMTSGVLVIVWLVWRSPVRYLLKAATLSAAIFIAIPRGFAYDLAAIAIPIAFLAKDQICCGLLRGEQTTLFALFLASLSIVPSGGHAPVGALISLTLFCLILRRALYYGESGRIA